MKQIAEDYGFEVTRSGTICCPFHNEDTPSMKLYDDHYHCFGCGAHGDAIDFVSRITGTDMLTAANAIKDQYHLTIKDETKQGSVLIKLEKAKKEQALDYFIRTLIKYCRLKEQILERSTHMSVYEHVKIITDIEYINGVLEMLQHTERKKKNDFINDYADTLKYCEAGIKEMGNITFAKESVVI